MAGPSSSPDLYCTESFITELSVAEEHDTYVDVIRNYVGDPETDEEYLTLMANREPDLGFNANESLLPEDWFAKARLEAITWILRIRKALRFHMHTAYLSVIYLDRYFLSGSVETPLHTSLPWVNLTSIACLSLAAKMEELEVPTLPGFQEGGTQIPSTAVKRMELHILSTLQWRMNYPTPFPFLRYFAVKLFVQETPESEIISKTVRSILALMKEIHLMTHRPSAIAAAAALLELNNSFTRTALENQMKSIACLGFLNTEDVFRCYSLLQGLKTEPHHTPNDLYSANKNSCLTSNRDGVKRRRLRFDDPD